MKNSAFLLLALAAVALPSSKSYDVVPFRNFVGTQTQGDLGVAQFYRNTLDSLWKVSVWIGDTVDTSSYNVVVYDSAIPTHQIAHGPTNGVHAPQCWSWLDFELTKDDDPVRGRTYKVVVSRTSGQPISFAYDPTNPYKYGSLSVGGTAHPDCDLALRVTGLMRPVEATDWGATAQFLTLA